MKGSLALEGSPLPFKDSKDRRLSRINFGIFACDAAMFCASSALDGHDHS